MSIQQGVNQILNQVIGSTIAKRYKQQELAAAEEKLSASEAKSNIAVAKQELAEAKATHADIKAKRAEIQKDIAYNERAIDGYQVDDTEYQEILTGTTELLEMYRKEGKAEIKAEKMVKAKQEALNLMIQKYGQNVQISQLLQQLKGGKK